MYHPSSMAATNMVRPMYPYHPGQPIYDAPPRTTKPRKLRAACDSCHQAKIKCSGGSPCARCAKDTRYCRYSFTARVGKPKGSKNKKTLEKLRLQALEAGETIEPEKQPEKKPKVKRSPSESRTSSTRRASPVVHGRIPSTISEPAVFSEREISPIGIHQASSFSQYGRPSGSIEFDFPGFEVHATHWDASIAPSPTTYADVFDVSSTPITPYGSIPSTLQGLTRPQEAIPENLEEMIADESESENLDFPPSVQDQFSERTSRRPSVPLTPNSGLQAPYLPAHIEDSLIGALYQQPQPQPQPQPPQLSGKQAIILGDYDHQYQLHQIHQQPPQNLQHQHQQLTENSHHGLLIGSGTTTPITATCTCLQLLHARSAQLRDIESHNCPPPLDAVLNFTLITIEQTETTLMCGDRCHADASVGAQILQVALQNLLTVFRWSDMNMDDTGSAATGIVATDVASCTNSNVGGNVEVGGVAINPPSPCSSAGDVAYGSSLPPLDVSIGGYRMGSEVAGLVKSALVGNILGNARRVFDCLEERLVVLNRSSGSDGDNDLGAQVLFMHNSLGGLKARLDSLERNFGSGEAGRGGLAMGAGLDGVRAF